MNAAAFDRHHIRVVREIAPDVPQVCVDRHKVLQILINLFSNAKHAMDAQNPPHQATGHPVETASPDHVKIMRPRQWDRHPQENLVQIFNPVSPPRKRATASASTAGPTPPRKWAAASRPRARAPAKGPPSSSNCPLLPDQEARTQRPKYHEQCRFRTQPAHPDYRRQSEPSTRISGKSCRPAEPAARLQQAGGGAFRRRPTDRPQRSSFEMDSAYQGQEGLEMVKKALAETGLTPWPSWTCACRPVGMASKPSQRIWEVNPELQIVVCTAYSDYSWEEMLRQSRPARQPGHPQETVRQCGSAATRPCPDQKMAAQRPGQLQACRTGSHGGAADGGTCRGQQIAAACPRSDFPRRFMPAPFPAPSRRLPERRFVDVNHASPRSPATRARR